MPSSCVAITRLGSHGTLYLKFVTCHPHPLCISNTHFAQWALSPCIETSLIVESYNHTSTMLIIHGKFHFVTHSFTHHLVITFLTDFFVLSIFAYFYCIQFILLHHHSILIYISINALRSSWFVHSTHHHTVFNLGWYPSPQVLCSIAVYIPITTSQ